MLDANGDGAVSLQDLEALSIQYLCGEGMLSNTTSSQVGNRIDSSQYSSSPYQKIQSKDYGNTNLIQNSQQSSKLDSEGYNLGSYNQYGSGSQYNDQSNMNSGYNQYAKNQ